MAQLRSGTTSLPTMQNFPFSAVLLAGGQSRRMGRDKSGLVIGGCLLWKRQLAILQQLEPQQLFICGRSDTIYEGAGCEVVTDDIPDSGPIGGLITALRHASASTLVLLAVDLPLMQPWFLQTLLEKAHADARSVIPASTDGLEPLAAVYRVESLEIAEKRLRAGQRSMHSLVNELQRQNLANLYTLQENEAPLFHNVNTPEELRRLEKIT